MLVRLDVLYEGEIFPEQGDIIESDFGGFPLLRESFSEISRKCSQKREYIRECLTRESLNNMRKCRGIISLRKGLIKRNNSIEDIKLGIEKV